MSSDGEQLRSSRSVENSDTNTDMEVDGGRYIVRNVKEVEQIESLMQRDSNDANVGIGIVVILRYER